MNNNGKGRKHKNYDILSIINIIHIKTTFSTSLQIKFVDTFLYKDFTSHIYFYQNLNERIHKN